MNLILNSEVKKKYKLKRTDFIIFSYFYQAMPYGGAPINLKILSFWTGQTPEYVKELIDIMISRGILVRTVVEGQTVILPVFEKKEMDVKEEKPNPILEFMLKHYEDKRLGENKTLKNRYIRAWTSSADELLDACEGDVELAKKLIKHYASKQTDEWKLWDVTNNFCKLYDELKRAKKI